MKYIVGLCGTHGTGKSTILHDSNKLGINIVESQLSRTAQKNLGWDSLKRVEESIDNVWHLQNAILDALLIRDKTITDSQQFTLVERTPIDLMAYTNVWCMRLNIDMDDYRATKYFVRCIQACNAYAHFIYVPTSNEIPFIADLHRADFESRNFVAGIIHGFFFTSSFPCTEIKSTKREHRALEVQKIFQLIL